MILSNLQWLIVYFPCFFLLYRVCVCFLFCRFAVFVFLCQICCSSFVPAFFMYFYCLFVFNHNVYCLCALDHIVYDMCTRYTVHEFKAQTCFPTHLTNPPKTNDKNKAKRTMFFFFGSRRLIYSLNTKFLLQMKNYKYLRKFNACKSNFTLIF